MKLQKVLKQNLNKLVPQAGILINLNNHLTSQMVFYQPQVLNLGAVLLAYYVTSQKIQSLSRLGDCLSVGHYVQSPRALRCGLDFAADPIFQGLPAKTRKHLTGELQDCTISFSRDLKINRPTRKISNVKQFLNTQPKLKEVYLYQNNRWQILRLSGQNLTQPVSLRLKISQLLKKA